MTLGQRDKRALIVLGVGAFAIAAWSIFSEDPSTTVRNTPAAATETIPGAENRLTRVKATAATLPGREEILAKVKGELTLRERGLIQADTAAQAQAQLLQIARRIARGSSGIELRNTEIGPAKPFGDHYGEVAVSVNFEAGIDQLINFLADLTTQKEMIGTTDLRVGTANPKQKTVPVRLTISGLVRRELIPERKSAGL